MSRQKLQLLVATCQEIPDRLNVRSCSTCAASCLNFQQVPEFYGSWGPGWMWWMWCTRDSARWGFGCHQLNGTCCAGLSHHVWMCPRSSPGPCLKLALSIATCPPPKHPRTQSKSIHFPSLSLLAWSSFTEAPVHMRYLELSWSDHWLFPNEQGLGMKRSRTVPYAGIGITGTKGRCVRPLLTAPALLISEKSLCLKCVYVEVSKSDTGCVCVCGVNQQQPQTPVLPLVDFTFCLSVIFWVFFFSYG